MAGYTSILDRVGLLITANINAVVDKALSVNKIAVFDEYVNRMNQAWDSLATAEGIERGRTKTLQRQIDELQTDCAKLDEDIDRLLLKGERMLAGARQSILNTKQGLLEDMRENLAFSKSEAEKLSNAKAKLQAQIEVTRAQRMALVSLIEQKRASEIRQKAQSSVRDLTSGKGRTDEVVSKARLELDRAHGLEEASSDSLERRIDELLGGDEIESQLALRESRLKQLPEGK